MKKLISQMTDEDKQRFIYVIGTMCLRIGEGFNSKQIADEIDLHPYQVDENIIELLYTIRKRIGVWRFIKTIFIK